MESETIHSIARAITPDMYRMSAIDICAHIERELRQKLGDESATEVRWVAETRDDQDELELHDWAPGQVVPDGAEKLRCHAEVRR